MAKGNGKAQTAGSTDVAAQMSAARDKAARIQARRDAAAGPAHEARARYERAATDFACEVVDVTAAMVAAAKEVSDRLGGELQVFETAVGVAKREVEALESAVASATEAAARQAKLDRCRHQGAERDRLLLQEVFANLQRIRDGGLAFLQVGRSLEDEGLVRENRPDLSARELHERAAARRLMRMITDALVEISDVAEGLKAPPHVRETRESDLRELLEEELRLTQWHVTGHYPEHERPRKPEFGSEAPVTEHAPSAGSAALLDVDRRRLGVRGRAG